MALSTEKLSRLEKHLAAASSSSIRDIMPRLNRWWKKGYWLSKRNVYRAHAVARVTRDSSDGHSLKSSDLGEYVAASTVIHCFDGWSFLGRALEAEMAGDPDAARHLGYYAELRAAMSVLASGGIGVFGRRHVVVTATQQCNAIRGGSTHEFAWDALKIWANLPAGREAVLGSVKPGGISLSEWLRQSSLSSNFVATDWLRRWGLDLSRIASDRHARNLSSYRPTALTSPGPRAVGETMKSVLHFWEMCDPSHSGGFPVLDQYLLRRSLDLIVRSARRGRQASMKNVEWHNKIIEDMLSGVTPAPPVDNWRSFLAFENLADVPQIIKDAGDKVDANHRDHSKQVLARATLLLRIATGCSGNLLREAEPGFPGDLSFWRSSASIRRRLWLQSNPVSSSVDLWQDIDDASSSVTDWLAQNGPSACHRWFWDDNALWASRLATAERVFLWGVGL